jgi:hypothetical protein
VQECSWVEFVAGADPLATPWSAVEVRVSSCVAPHDADDLLRTRGRTVPPQQVAARDPQPLSR